jgi:thymidylate kinase
MINKSLIWNFLINGDKDDNSRNRFGSEDQVPKAITMWVINNPDGTPRWIFPSTLKKPDFLKFYPVLSLRTQVISLIFKTLFYTRLIGLVAKKFVVKYNSAPYFFRWIKEDCSQYAFFAGTIGPNQKVLIFSRSSEGKGVFSKIAYGSSSVQLINNESAALSFLSSNGLKSFDFPHIVYQNATSLSINELDMGISVNRLTSVHVGALQDLYNLKMFKSNKEKITLDDQVYRLDLLISRDPEMINLKDCIQQSFSLVKKRNREVKVGLGHGDFTPWNCGVKNERAVILDWEMTDEYPLLYDVFHFIIQNKIMNTQEGMSSIFKEVIKTMHSTPLLKLCEDNQIIWKDQFEVYLLTVSLYYFNVYHKQSKLHVQAYRAMSIWREFLAEVTFKTKNRGMRKLFLKKLFAEMQNSQYALMKNDNKVIDEFNESSDLDLFLSKSTSRKVIEWLGQQPEILKFRIFKSSYMSVGSIYLKDGSFLSIDFIFKLKQRSIEYLSVQDVIVDSKVTEEGVKIPAVLNDIEYMLLFYQLNNAPIPMKYYSYIDRLNPFDKKNIFQKIKCKMRLSSESFSDFFRKDNNLLKKELLKYVGTKPVNKNWLGIQNRLDYFLDLFRRFALLKKGVVISFSGVDGAGKSTVISHIKERLEKRYRRKVIVLRHRPSILPILSSFIYGKKAAEEKAAKTLPRQGSNSSLLSSLFRFLYYLVDFIFGQFIIWYRHILKGEVILYDRYYFDFIEDPKRTNIELPRWFRKFFYVTVYKPSVNVFLHAKPELILERKQELSYKDIVELTASYKNLFLEYDNIYSGRYVCIENNELSSTLNHIESLITEAA